MEPFPGGMIPKIEGALEAIRSGLHSVTIVDGRVATHVCLRYLPKKVLARRFYATNRQILCNNIPSFAMMGYYLSLIQPITAMICQCNQYQITPNSIAMPIIAPVNIKLVY